MYQKENFISPESYYYIIYSFRTQKPSLFRIFTEFNISTARTTSAIFGFTKGPGYVLVFHHVFDLPLHCYKEEDYEIEEQDWPEYWHIENAKERHEE